MLEVVLRPIRLTISFLLPLFLLIPLWAHDLYSLPDFFQTHEGAKLQIAFHNGDSFPLSEVAPTVATLQDAKLVAAMGVAKFAILQIARTETVGTATVPATGEPGRVSHSRSR
jgi:hypothetical protein